uniref:uncharacterized protein LOC118522396 n=1 Tax=Halichoerus grypus TaxID=9711 RepID=UPI001659C648|nr:uncharacterized protein LOC118522396 [Halichoerus grypus]
MSRVFPGMGRHVGVRRTTSVVRSEPAAVAPSVRLRVERPWPPSVRLRVERPCPPPSVRLRGPRAASGADRTATAVNRGSRARRESPAAQPVGGPPRPDLVPLSPPLQRLQPAFPSVSRPAGPRPHALGGCGVARGLGEAAPLNRSFPAVLGSAGGGRFAPDPELSGKQPVWLRAWVRGDACWDGKLEAGGYLLSPLRAPGSGRVLRVEQEAGPGRRLCGARTSPVIPHNEPAFQAECKSGSRGEAIRQTPGDPGATAAGRRGREAAFPLSCEGWLCVSSGAGRVGRGSIADGGVMAGALSAILEYEDKGHLMED